MCHMNAEDKVIQEYRGRALKVFMLWVLPVAPIAAYLNGMAMGVAGWSGLIAVAWVLPPIIVGLGIAYPAFVMHVLVNGALRERPEDTPGARLERILRLPWRAAVASSWGAWTLGGLWFSLHVCLLWKKDLSLVVVGTLIGICFGVVQGFPISVTLERLLLPLALEEQRKDPTMALKGGGFFWPRQAWFMPVTFIGSSICALVLSGCVVLVKLQGVRDELHNALVAEGAHGSAETLMGMGGMLAGELAFGLAWVGGLLAIPAVTTWMLARRQAHAAGAVGVAIESLSAGRVVSPAWVSTDEMGDLSAGMNAVLVRLRQLPLALNASATRLSGAGRHLRDSHDEHQQSLVRQASALHEAQMTSEEIRRTSLMAVERAEEVLQVARRSEALGQQGESAVERSLNGLADIRRVVDGIQERLTRLAQSTTQIGEITETVKDLADQSHLLAVNAAIEAARSGEQGRGFAVVAREIRGLSDQSIQATRRIRGILQDISTGIRDAAKMGEAGVQTIGTGLDQMRASGDSLRELSRIAQENSTAARQIAAAVTQQDAGFTQIFDAIADLSQLMDATLKRLESTQEATDTLRVVSDDVARMARQFNATG
ncbi:methyl-accepting chemotaxis protein [Myxococcus xanthus DK 1622]|uniref:Methyl-accepting chemotaxis protein n=2 Tax=Myxococcaceae TaxID=31 RepID=Q1DCW6_MYXXD|nr:methyl-accepting chemotaxis protein [Myxococcus xanthus DK 1622]NOJ53437.1 methyl-accepting chemotaxis protein [Myxococcus xanthus]QPM80893.1 methyl-accepting chemotaxis protein [Myxococcus xanthus]QVW69953.1 methyl-accepting chemotaxis protein [Myxococcus xanthus DZ2]UEO03918.1 methyl-accepting chemotaxis protein [Myxococcus xanthus DZ2]